MHAKGQLPLKVVSCPPGADAQQLAVKGGPSRRTTLPPHTPACMRSSLPLLGSLGEGNMDGLQSAQFPYILPTSSISEADVLQITFLPNNTRSLQTLPSPITIVCYAKLSSRLSPAALESLKKQI